MPLVSGKSGRPLKKKMRFPKDEEPKKKRGRPVLPDSEKKKRKPRAQVNFHFPAGSDVADADKLMDSLKKIAKKEMSLPTAQAWYFIKEGIERYDAKQNKEKEALS